MKNYLIDTHAHLDFPELYNRLDEILKNAMDNDKLTKYSCTYL